MNSGGLSSGEGEGEGEAEAEAEEEEWRAGGGSTSGPPACCCLLEEGERCRRPATNASYNKRVQKTVTQKRLRLSLDLSARHIFICDFHKTMIQNARTKQRRRKDSEDDGNETDTDFPEIDLLQLQANTLRRYKRHYKLSTRPGTSNKAQLVDTIQKHFKSIPVNEKEILAYFIYMVKTNGNKLDQKNGLNSDSL